MEQFTYLIGVQGTLDQWLTSLEEEILEMLITSPDEELTENAQHLMMVELDVEEMEFNKSLLDKLLTMVSKEIELEYLTRKGYVIDNNIKTRACTLSNVLMGDRVFDVQILKPDLLDSLAFSLNLQHFG